MYLKPLCMFYAILTMQAQCLEPKRMGVKNRKPLALFVFKAYLKNSFLNMKNNI